MKNPSPFLIDNSKTDQSLNLMTGKIEIRIESEMNHESKVDRNQDISQHQKSYQREIESL